MKPRTIEREVFEAGPPSLTTARRAGSWAIEAIKSGLRSGAEHGATAEQHNRLAQTAKFRAVHFAWFLRQNLKAELDQGTRFRAEGQPYGLFMEAQSIDSDQRELTAMLMDISAVQHSTRLMLRVSKPPGEPTSRQILDTRFALGTVEYETGKFFGVSSYSSKEQAELHNIAIRAMNDIERAQRDGELAIDPYRFPPAGVSKLVEQPLIPD
jgi:hypothetical protein